MAKNSNRKRSQNLFSQEFWKRRKIRSFSFIIVITAVAVISYSIGLYQFKNLQNNASVSPTPNYQRYNMYTSPNHTYPAQANVTPTSAINYIPQYQTLNGILDASRNNVYSDTKNGFSFVFPKNWIIAYTPTPGVPPYVSRVSIVSKQNTAKPIFLDVNIYSLNDPNYATKRILSVPPGFSEIPDGQLFFYKKIADITVNGVKGVKITTHAVQDEIMFSIDYLLVKNNIVYDIAFNCGDEQVLNSNEYLLDQIANTFTITN